MHQYYFEVVDRLMCDTIEKIDHCNKNKRLVERK